MKYGKQINRILSMIMVVAMVLSMMPTTTAHAANNVSGGNLYFDNSVTGWTDSYIYFVIGHNSWSSLYRMTKVDDAGDLYKVTIPSWGGSTYYAIIGTSSSWGEDAWGPSNLKNANHYTAAYTSNYGLNSGNNYVFTPASAANGTALSIGWYGTTPYAVSVADCTNGTVTASKSVAESGNKITLTVTPAKGYDLDELSVKKGTTAVTVTNNTFTMPAGNVTVSATFKLHVHSYVNGTCACGAVCDHTDSKHTAYTYSDGRHTYSCTVCNSSITKACSGGTATCASGKVCDTCKNEYTAKDGTNHDSNVAYVNGVCPNGCIDPNYTTYTATIYFQKPAGWSKVNAYVWNPFDSNGPISGYEAYNAWPGKEISEVSGHAGWYELKITKDTDTGFNFIFNDGSNQSDNLWSDTLTKDTVLWFIGNTSYTTAPESWDAPSEPAVTYYVAGDNADIFGAAWDPVNAAGKMVDAGNGVYTKVFSNVAAGTYSLKVTDGTWDNTWGDNGQNYPIQVSATCDVTVTFDSNAKTVTVTGDHVTKVTTLEITSMHAVGNGSDAWLGGTDWDPTGNAMTEVSENVYEITFKNVAKGSDYLFKFAANGSWNDSWGKGANDNEAAYNGQNIPLEITYNKADVTLKLDLTNYNHTTKTGATYSVTVTEVIVPDYYLIGYINGANYGCEGDSANLGEYKFVDGKLTATFTQDSYVFVKTGDNANWYMSEGYAAASPATLYNTSKGLTDANKLFVPANVEVEFTLVENDDGSLTLSYTKGAVVDNPTGTYYVAGDEALCGVHWNEKAEANKMDYAGNGVFTKVYADVAAGTYNLKVTDGTWDNTWGDNGSNYNFAVSAACDVTVTFDSNTKTVTVSGDSVSKVTTLEVTSMHAVGNGSGAWLGGVSWDPTANAMTEVSENVYEITFKNVIKGSEYKFKFAANGSWNDNWGKGAGANEAAYNGQDIPLTVTYDKADVTMKLDLTNYNHTDKSGATYTVTVTEVGGSATEYYLVGYINGADNDGNTYKFVDGSLTVELSSESYVLLKDSSGQHYIPAAAVSDATSAVLNKGDWDYDRKVKVPSGKITFTLTENTDGSLTLSYAAVVDVPQIPDGYNTVTIHFLKPSTWGGSVNGYIWTDAGALTGYEAFNTWPGSRIPANKDKDGWYDLVVGTENPQSFNFIFNNGSSQTADLTTGEVTGPTELWVVGNDVYTAAPMEWTHYTATLHFQKPGDWGDTACLYAWTDNTTDIMGAWPGAIAPASTKNAGWHTAIVKVEIGRTLNFIFNNNNNGKQTADLTAGKLTGNIELWIDGNGNSVAAPNGWIDENRTVHVPGTFPGKSWDAASNQMTYDPTRGLYVITFENVPTGTYYYKIAINGGWGENYGNGGEPNGTDIAVTVPTAQDVTIWYSDVTHRTLCSVDYNIDAVVNLSGTGIPAGTKLTDPNLTGLFSATIKLPAGKYSDITITFGSYTSTFAEFELTAEKDVTFVFDPSSYLAYHNGSEKKVETDKIYYNTRELKYKDPFGAVATGEDVTFAIETGTDASQVSLIVKGRRGVFMEKDGEPVDGVQRWVCTTKFDNVGEYQYYFAITNGSDMVFYTDDIYHNYYKKGDYGTGTVRDIQNLFPYDLVVYQAGYTTPDWMKNAVIYQIFPDRFFDGDETNNQAQTDARGSVDYEYVSDWYLLPENPEMSGKPGYPVYAYKGDGEWSNEIYGGDLEGITERIGYLKALGVNVIYLNPVFSSISNHRYDACDYTQIDPILGTLGDFEELVAVAEANGMKIILDGVFNHVSDDSIYFDRYYKFLGTSEKIGAYPYWAYVYDYMAEKSASQAAAEAAAKTYFTNNYGITDYSYTEWFAVENKQATYSDTIGLRAGKKVYTYEGWWGYDSMPIIKSTNGSEYQTGNWADEIIYNSDASSVSQYWINKGNDGWRLDVANEVSDETWVHFRNSVKALNSDAVIIGEIWADATHYLMGNMYDSVMNYVFRDAVAGFARGYLINRDNKEVRWDEDYTASDAIATLEILRERYPQEAFYAMMNLVASHDTSRILSYLDGVEDDRHQKDMDSAFPTYEKTSSRAKQLQYVVAFVQFTYAGAPTIYYGDEIGMVGGDDPDDRRAMEWGMGNQTLVEWYAKLAAIRSQYPALRTGDVKSFAPSRDVMGYVRSDDSDTLIALANRAASQSTVELDLVELGLVNENTRATVTLTDLVTGNTYTTENNKITVSVDAYRGAILTRNVKSISVNTGALAPAYDDAYIVPDRAATAPKGTYNTQNNQKVTIGDSLSFTVDAVVNTFVGVSVDGEKLNEEDFAVKVGTEITLSAELIEELGEGEHEIVIEFEGGSATAKFTVAKAADPDQPGAGGDPDQPGAGGDPDQPGAGGDPDQPGAGGDPDQPGAGGDPDQPGAGGDPDQPGAGGDPDQPGAGGDPDQPGEGGDPDQPGAGGDPDQPGEGGDPDQPGGDDPDQPGEGDDPDQPGDDETTETTKPGTGDNSNTGDTSGIGIWVAVLGISLMAVIFLVILGLKKKKN